MQFIPSHLKHIISGLGSSVRNIEKICPKAEVIKEIAFHGGSVKNVKEGVEKWIN